MPALISLAAFLDAYAGTDATKLAVARTVLQIAAASKAVREFIHQRALGGGAAKERGTANAGGDLQHELDIHLGEMFVAAMREAPVAYCACPQFRSPRTLDPEAPLAIALNPLDGASEIDTNISIGTIFSILPKLAAANDDPVASFLQAGDAQLAAGFVLYGPQTTLVLTLGAGTHTFIFHPELATYQQSVVGLVISPQTTEFAISTANYRYWQDGIRYYVDDCLAGAEGPREKNFNTRWAASLVADAYRVLMRGGVFLEPADRRDGHHSGRVRLVFEASPIAMLAEQAGGSATDTINRLLAVVPTSLHQRIPFVFGSKKEVERITRYHVEPLAIERSPLFGHRSLFRT